MILYRKHFKSFNANDDYFTSGTGDDYTVPVEITKKLMRKRDQLRVERSYFSKLQRLKNVTESILEWSAMNPEHLDSCNGCRGKCL